MYLNMQWRMHDQQKDQFNLDWILFHSAELKSSGNNGQKICYNAELVTHNNYIN